MAWEEKSQRSHGGEAISIKFIFGKKNTVLKAKKWLKTLLKYRVVQADHHKKEISIPNHPFSEASCSFQEGYYVVYVCTFTSSRGMSFQFLLRLFFLHIAIPSQISNQNKHEAQNF